MRPDRSVCVCVFVFYVTCNDISVIYVTVEMCRRLKRKLYLLSGSQRHRHFVGFFNMPVLHRHWPPFLCGYSEKPPHLVDFYDTLGRFVVYGQLIKLLNVAAMLASSLCYKNNLQYDTQQSTTRLPWNTVFSATVLCSVNEMTALASVWLIHFPTFSLHLLNGI